MTFMGKFKKLFNKNKYTTSQVIYKNSTSQYTVTAECTMKLSSKTEEKKKEINEKLKDLIKKYMYNPEKLIQYMMFKGIKVYRIENAASILSFFGEEEGFIIPLKGIKAIVLNLLLSNNTKNKPKISFTTKEMLIFDTKNVDIYSISRALHKYYGFKNNLPGFDTAAQSAFKKIYNKSNIKNRASYMEALSLKDIFACKEALARDLESVNFTLQLAMEYEKSKKALNNIIQENQTHI